MLPECLARVDRFVRRNRWCKTDISATSQRVYDDSHVADRTVAMRRGPPDDYQRATVGFDRDAVQVRASASVPQVPDMRRGERDES